MKYLLICLFLFVNLSCNENIQKKEGSNKKVMNRFSYRTILNSTNNESDYGVLKRIQYIITKVDEKSHSQSIFLEDSTVEFELNIGGEKHVEQLTSLVLIYDKFGISNVVTDGGFAVGQVWNLYFDKQGNLVKMDLQKK